MCLRHINHETICFGLHKNFENMRFKMAKLFAETDIPVWYQYLIAGFIKTDRKSDWSQWLPFSLRIWRKQTQLPGSTIGQGEIYETVSLKPNNHKYSRFLTEKQVRCRTVLNDQLCQWTTEQCCIHFADLLSKSCHLDFLENKECSGSFQKIGERRILE